MSTLVALHAHPDDEASKGAGTVARYADAGVRCVLVTATGGEAGDILNPAMDREEVRERLHEIRLAELDEAARIIGYDEVIHLGYRDSGMPDTDDNQHPDAFVNVPFEEALAAVVAIVRTERPQVLLGYDEHSRYPHPDHIRIHELSLAAFEAAADPERFPDAGAPWEISKLYAPVFMRARITQLHEAMIERGLESPFERRLKWMEENPEPDPEVVSRVKVSETLERARRALLAHQTQVDPNGQWFAAPIDLVLDVYPFEEFELLASRVKVSDQEEDLFAGI